MSLELRPDASTVPLYSVWVDPESGRSYVNMSTVHEVETKTSESESKNSESSMLLGGTDGSASVVSWIQTADVPLIDRPTVDAMFSSQQLVEDTVISVQAFPWAGYTPYGVLKIGISRIFFDYSRLNLFRPTGGPMLTIDEMRGTQNQDEASEFPYRRPDPYTLFIEFFNDDDEKVLTIEIVHNIVPQLQIETPARTCFNVNMSVETATSLKQDLVSELLRGMDATDEALAVMYRPDRRLFSFPCRKTLVKLPSQ